MGLNSMINMVENNNILRGPVLPKKKKIKNPLCRRLFATRARARRRTGRRQSGARWTSSQICHLGRSASRPQRVSGLLPSHMEAPRDAPRDAVSTESTTSHSVDLLKGMGRKRLPFLESWHLREREGWGVKELLCSTRPTLDWMVAKCESVSLEQINGVVSCFGVALVTANENACFQHAIDALWFIVLWIRNVIMVSLFKIGSQTTVESDDSC